MIKKFYLLLLLLMPLSVMAQTGTGSWTVHSRFLATSAKNIIDTENSVYYLLGNDLFCLNKVTKENVSLNKTNSLSDVLVNGIYYNYDKNYLVVTYDDANIDVITSDGIQYNIPNVKDALIPEEKGINHVTFGSLGIYVSTKFGYLLIDDNNFTVKEYHNYSTNIYSTEEVGDKLILSASGYFYYSGKSAKHETLSNFGKAQNYTADSTGVVTKTYNGKTYAVSDSKFFLNSAGNCLYMVTMATNGNSTTFTRTQVVAAVADNVQKTPTGFLANFMANKYYYTFDANGGNATKKSTSLNEMFSCNPNGDGTMWSINTNGVHSSAAASTYYKIDGILITTVPWWMAYNKSEHKMYLSSTSDNGILTQIFSSARCEMNTFDGSVWADAKPSGAPTTAGDGWYYPEFNPNDSSMYFISGRTKGIYRIQNGAVTANLGTASPMVDRKAVIRFDKDGNLWIVHSSRSNTTPVKVLPRAKLANSSFSASDYTVFKVPNVADINSFKWSNFAISKGTDIKVFTTGDLAPLVIWDNNGQITDGTNFRSRSFKRLTSKTAKTITWAYTYALKADDFGYVWMGNGGNLVRFNPAEAFDEDFRVDDISAVMGNTMTTAIEFGKDNTVWIATYGAGIFVLNQDGTEVLQNFTTANSPLPTNSIYNICYDPDRESMFVVTPTCVLEYSYEFRGGETTYDNVEIYPEPVKPDFTGYVAIKRLIPGSYVKITDAAGNVVCETTDVAGTATWDACNSNGERVPTGTYYVYAATTQNVPMDKPVGRIMVIK